MSEDKEKRLVADLLELNRECLFLRSLIVKMGQARDKGGGVFEITITQRELPYLKAELSSAG
jgi:hypothetical protein